MIKGLYEAHLPVKDMNASIEFYQNLGLELSYQADSVTFFWIEKGRSWLGLWEGEEVNTPYHPSLRHIAFRVDYVSMKESPFWLQERNIEAVPFRGRNSIEPFVRPDQGNASVYFKDIDGNSLEFMCYINVPEKFKGIKSVSLIEWEQLLNQDR